MTLFFCVMFSLGCCLMAWSHSPTCTQTHESRREFGCTCLFVENLAISLIYVMKITDELRKNYGKIPHISLTNHALQRIHGCTQIIFFSNFQWYVGVTSSKHASYVCSSSLESRRWTRLRQYFRERSLIFHAYFTVCRRKNYAKLRKTAQCYVNSYAKPNFELLRTWNRIKHRYGETSADNYQKTDEMRKSLMYRLRLEFCAWFMR